jgi:hypothetical protein
MEPVYEFIYEGWNTNCQGCVADRGRRYAAESLCNRLPDDCMAGGHFRIRPWWKFWVTPIKPSSDKAVPKGKL